MTNIKRESICRHIKQIIVMLLLLSLVTTVFPFSVFAEERKANKVVRVGWHEQPYFITDENGRYSGYTYDYQQKISAYTGWIYEYVSGSWSELLQMLKDGEIDMLGNVSYTEERANDMLYSSLPMGTESYYLFASQKNKDIRMNDYSSLNGKKIGVAKDSIQSKMLKEWMQKYEVQAELIEMTTQEKESMQLIDSDIDAFVTMDFHVNPQKYVPVWKIGGSDYYFAVSKSSSDLLNDLNFAMGRIKNENKLFDVQLNEKYLQNTEAELYVSDREQEWLSKHKTIRVGYQNNYLAFCSKDERTGELIGALKDYLNYASTALKNVELNFETISYPTVSEAIADLKKGKIDCVFPANLTYYDSEMQGLAMSPEIMTTEMDAIVRSSDRKEFLQKKQVTVAVNEGNTNYELFLKDRFPGWNVKHYKDTSKGLEAVAKGEADCVINVGVSGPGVVRAALAKADNCNITEVADIVKKTAFKITRMGQLVAKEASKRLSVPFGIVDLSLAPTPAIGDSVAYILEEMGLEQCGAHGTTACLALLNDAVKKGGVMASSHVGGLSGAFIPVTEDAGMIEAARSKALTLTKLEAMTAVCSVGLDMIAIPGDTSADIISGIIADEAAIGMVNSKTTAVRLIPAIGKKAGEELNFGGLLGNGPIMDVNPKSPAKFISRGGRIPAPMQSLKN